MIYVEPSSIGWKPHYISWKNNLPTTFRPEDIENIDLLFDWLIDPALEYIRRACHEISPTQDINLVQSLMRIYRSLLKDLEEENLYNSLDIKIRHNILD